MADTIQIETIPDQPANIPFELGRSLINAEQVQALITLIASANPPVVALQEGKTWADLKGFHVRVFPDGTGRVLVQSE